MRGISANDGGVDELLINLYHSDPNDTSSTVIIQIDEEIDRLDTNMGTNSDYVIYNLNMFNKLHNAVQNNYKIYSLFKKPDNSIIKQDIFNIIETSSTNIVDGVKVEAILYMFYLAVDVNGNKMLVRIVNMDE